MASKSIMSNEKECFMCHQTENLERHHIFFGTANRKLSEHDGCWCYLCPEHHNASKHSVHYNRKYDLYLKEECERRWMEKYQKTEEDFIERYGKSYL